MEQLVCGVIVTYHPDSDLERRIALLRSQVHSLAVVDNGSSEEELVMLRRLSVSQSFELVENSENLGIATALNQGIAYANSQGVQFVALFDQDSAVTEGFIAAMLLFFCENASKEKLGIVVPKYIDNRLGGVLPAVYAADGDIGMAMTSGSLIPLTIFAELGYFEEGLFIGGVDFEYSLRVRSRGYKIKECTEATLMHEPATPVVHRLGRMSLFTTSNYNPLRRYYSERNRAWIRAKYRWSFPRECMGLYLSSGKEWMKILLGEKDKWRKFHFMALGIRDGLKGKMGRNVSLETR